MRNILLDMDGVCVNFTAGMDKAHGFAFTWDTWNVWDQIPGMTEEDWWRPANFASFWVDLEPYSWFEDMYFALGTIGEVYFVTSPSLDSLSSAGKVQWLKNRFGKHFTKFAITSQKHLMSMRGNVLIDDSDRNVERFEHYSGNAVLFPQPWNKRKSECGVWEPMIDLINEVRACPR